MKTLRTHFIQKINGKLSTRQSRRHLRLLRPDGLAMTVNLDSCDYLYKMMTDIDYMKKAYQLAIKGKGKTSPNPLVGAVIVKGSKVVSSGWHRRCGTDHAEVIALKNARNSVSGTRMYVTLEPCFHFGRTPPCVDRIIESGIKEVVIGMKDPNPLTNGKSIAKLRRAGIKTKVGFLQQELTTMNEAFVKYTVKKMPFIAIKSAQSLDGKIATAKGESKWITSNAARLYARRIRDEFDAILVGINTVIKDNPRLNASKKSKHLKKIILDSSLKIPLKARLFVKMKPSDMIIATTAKASAKKRTKLVKKGIDLIICPKRKEKIDLKYLFKELAKREITSVLVEGGSHVIGSVLKERLADKMYCYIAPMIMGDKEALSSISGVNVTRISKAIRLKEAKYKIIGKDILVEGNIVY